MKSTHFPRPLKYYLLFFGLAVWLASPSPALANGEDPAIPIAGTLAWIFLVFGVGVISAVAVILFTKTKSQAGQSSPSQFETLSGFSGYIGKMRLFSRNARLYMVHVVGMDVIYGTWAVLFNLYLLAIGFSIEFIGLRIFLQSTARAIASIPAGVISDRIGRKLSFILGDGIGATMSLVAISTTNETLLLTTAVIGGLFSALHGVSEPAFMAENSANHERVHLFSVSSGTRTAAAIIGSALAGLIPFLAAGTDNIAKVEIYRIVAYAGIGGWFASLIPALMLTQVAAGKHPADKPKGLFSGIKHPKRIFQLTLPAVFIGLGAGFALPLMNVFFKSGVGSEEIEIGAVFAAGETFLVLGSFLAPLIAARIGKIRSVIWTRLASIPFILLIAFSPSIGGTIGSVLSVAGLAYMARITLMNMGAPLRSAFAMEILDPQERGTQVGIQLAISSLLSGFAVLIGSRFMEAGNFSAPFLLMAAFYLLSTILFWKFFDGKEQSLSLTAAD